MLRSPADGFNTKYFCRCNYLLLLVMLLAEKGSHFICLAAALERSELELVNSPLFLSLWSGAAFSRYALGVCFDFRVMQPLKTISHPVYIEAQVAHPV
jgi:hypothetical protein